MTDRSPPWYLKRTGFRAHVPPADLGVFMRVCPERRHEEGTTLFRAGDPATHLHVIAQGQVKLVVPTAQGQERILAVCGPEDFVGEAFVFATDRYRVDAVALTDAVTCAMSREQFAQLALHAPGFVLAFTGILATSLFDCREQLGSAFDPVRVRVAKILLDQAARFGTEDGEEGWVRLDTRLRHDELAAMASATRVSVTTAITGFRDAGLLEGTRGRYRLHLPALTVLADPAG